MRDVGPLIATEMRTVVRCMDTSLTTCEQEDISIYVSSNVFWFPTDRFERSSLDKGRNVCGDK